MRPNVQQYWVYMMTNRWKNVLYTGVSNSLEKRVWQHKNGAIPGFTKKYNCHFLVRAGDRTGERDQGLGAHQEERARRDDEPGVEGSRG